MAGCQAWVYEKGRKGAPLRGRPCSMKAVVKIPDGMDLKPGWVCAYHAPAKLLLKTKGENTAK